MYGIQIMPSDKYDIILVVIVGTLVVIIAVIFSLLLFMRFKKRQTEHFIEKQKLEFQFNETLLKAQLEITEQTLNNVSQEIHDNIGQVLTLAKLTISTIETNDLQVFNQKKESSTMLLSKAIQDLRHLSKGLNTDYITEVGFLRSIEYEMDFLKRAGTFKTTLNIEGAFYKLAQQQELILFRIFQEILNNIIKHSKASLVTINLFYEADFFKIEIKDDGKGFDLNLQKIGNQPSGIGLHSMYSRAKLINAEFNICSNPGEGTHVTIVLPRAFFPTLAP